MLESWGRLAEVCGEYLHVGARVFIEGKIRVDEWTDRDGNKRYTNKIRVDEVRFLNTDKSKQSGPGESRRQGPSGNEQQQSFPETEEDFEDDIPF